MRTTDYESSCRIYEELGLVIDKLLGKYRLKYILLDILMDLLLRYILIMLCRQNDCLKSYRLIILIIFYRYLGLTVGTEILKCSVLSNLSKL